VEPVDANQHGLLPAMHIWHFFSSFFLMRRMWFTLVLLLAAFTVRTNDDTLRLFNPQNKLFIITLDGLRWQELFYGADSTLITRKDYNANPSATQARFWHPSLHERRKKLFPFFWNLIAKQGELYGNREASNKVNVANPYALSYPGYNELLTGRVDYTLFGNGRSVNANHNVMEFLNQSAAYRGKVAAFTSWDAFPFILADKRNNLYINSGPGLANTTNSFANQSLLQQLETVLDDNKTTRDDVTTYLSCKEYIQQKQPSIVFLGFGGTDEAAHNKQYDVYLQQAANADRMLHDLWQFVQTQPAYKDQTTFLITTDHGRGARTGNWYAHGAFVAGSSQTWLALIGKGINANGEHLTEAQYYQKDLKKIMLNILSN
jgi:hypothetical protein